ncbi:hypothetical protein C0995_013251 [Termitomyces sp. Mi166|nr:hypothetical protein C0995_013251 [Termitomyces sp. Mi166\
MSHTTSNESSALLARSEESASTRPSAISKTRHIIWIILTVLFVGSLVLFVGFQHLLAELYPLFGLPKDPLDAALAILNRAPVIVGLYELSETRGGVGRLPKRDLERSTFQIAASSTDIKTAIKNGKIASLLGVEGAHQIGNSLAVLRQYYTLGIRYMTLTHTCHNAFADSCGYLPGIIPLHNGLSVLGRTMIREMNRLGVLVDLSHTSDATATEALRISKAPVIWSHSSARAVHDVPRNVPDEILRLVGVSEGQRDAVVMVNFAPFFVPGPGEANVQTVADHVEHIAKVAGKEHVGLGSDYDGIGDVPEGLEDVSKYPALIAELYKRGWNKYELAGLTGGNLLRIFEGAEKVSRELQATGQDPAYDLYDKRKDIPRTEF